VCCTRRFCVLLGKARCGTRRYSSEPEGTHTYSVVLDCVSVWDSVELSMVFDIDWWTILGGTQHRTRLGFGPLVSVGLRLRYQHIQYLIQFTQSRACFISLARPPLRAPLQPRLMQPSSRTHRVPTCTASAVITSGRPRLPQHPASIAPTRWSRNRTLGKAGHLSGISPTSTRLWPSDEGQAR